MLKPRTRVTQVNPLAAVAVLGASAYRGFFPLAAYRLYRLDGAGKIMSADWLEAEGDEEARDEARARADSGSFELWERNRLIDRFGSDSTAD